jgi:hypothetical protein
MPSRRRIDEYVVELSVRVEEVVPVALLVTRVNVTRDATVLVSDENDRVRVLGLFAEPVTVSLRDAFSAGKEARWIELVMKANERCGELSELGDVLERGGSYREHAEKLMGNRKVCGLFLVFRA